MGWTGLHRQSGQTMKEFFEKEWNTKRILDCAMVNRSTVYMAYQTETQGIIGLVVLVRFGKGYYNFHYKDMDESMGPCEDHCPERILKLLTPTTYEHALDWRKRCWDNVNKRKAKPKLKIGGILKFKEAIRFRNGRFEDTFTVVNPRTMLVKNKYGDLFRLNRYTLNQTENYEYTIGEVK